PSFNQSASGSVDLSVIPRLTMRFAHTNAHARTYTSSAALTFTGSAKIALAVNAKAGANCTVPCPRCPGPLGDDYPIATLEGQIGPFPVVVDVIGDVSLEGGIRASADASDAIKATGHLQGGVAWSE